MTEPFVMSDHERRLLSMGQSFLAVDVDRVNLDDLLDILPGSIVRCLGNPRDVIMLVPSGEGEIGCVAGWISEDDA